MMMSEARAEKAESDRIAFIEDQAAIDQQKFIAEWLKANPQIGTLTRDGKTVYYVWPVGGEYCELELPL